MSTDAYRKCAKCGITAIQDGALSFHRFPKPGKTNVGRARAWANFCWPDQDWTSLDDLSKLFKSNKVLCKRHFKDFCFTDTTKKQLGRYSVPTEDNVAVDSSHQVALNIETVAQVTCEISPQPGPSCVTNLSKSKTKKISTGILKNINVKKFVELSAREKKLYKICSQSFKEISRLRKSLKSKKKAAKLEKICENENVQKLTDLKLSNTFIVLLQNQLQNCKRQLKGRRYNVDQKIMALTLYKKSPACYRLLRRMFALPCQSTLKKMLNKIPLKTGINKQVFESLKRMAEGQLEDENLCILVFDEMTIKKHLYYNEKTDIIEGFQDHGSHNRTNQIACNALMFMLTGLRKKWKQPVSFYFSGKSVTSDRLSVIIKETLHECWKTGLVVVATVCDLSRVNIKALDILGSTKENPYFVHDGHEVVTILDPPHLIKCTRNMFLKHDIECLITNINNIDGQTARGVAKWSHVQKFYELDKNNPNFVFAPALTEHHLNPNSKQKMRVKLAVQVFSHKVTAGILHKIATNELPSEASATAALLINFDQLFDAVNADTPDLRGGKKFSTNMTPRSSHLQLFRNMRKFISEMKFIGSNSPPPSQVGWIRTINAVERLWKNLQDLGVNTLSTRRLNQDPLENCFGCIRYHCGSNDNPSTGQFIAGAKTAIINNLRHSGLKRNCEDDEFILNDNLKIFLFPTDKQPDNISTGESSTVDFEPLIADATEAIEQASAEAQACAYVCGLIFKKNKHKCICCKQIFLSSESTDDININLFTDFREYNEMDRSLTYVNIQFVQCIEVCASAVNKILNEEGWKKGLKNNVISALSQVDFNFLLKCPEHYDENKKHLIISTFRICIKRYTVLRNREFNEEEKSKSLQKKMRILKNK